MTVQNSTVKIEGEEDHVILVFDRMQDYFVTTWQDADQLGYTLDLAARETPSGHDISPITVDHQQAQVRLNKDKSGNVYLIFSEHTDRIKLCPMAAKLVGAALRKTAQDAKLATRKGNKVHILYNKKGLIKAIYNQMDGHDYFRQDIPGR